MNAIARAIATRRRCPPDSSDGILSTCSRQADEAEHFYRPGGPRLRAACRSLRTACSRRSRGRSANRTARLPGRSYPRSRGPSSAVLRSGWSTRWPFTNTSPASARSRPTMIFRIVDFPDPLAPRMIFVRPFGTTKLTPRSTTFSSNARATLSNAITAGACLCHRRQSQQQHENLRDEEVGRNHGHRAGNHRHRRRSTDALRAAGRPQADVARDGDDHEAEHERLDEPLIDVLRCRASR